MELVTVNNDHGNNQDHAMQRPTTQNLNQNHYPFRVNDVQLPNVQSGYVYMLISLRHPNFSYIGETICIRSRIQMHNSGNGAQATAPSYLGPFALFAYIFGFSSTSRTHLRFYIEQQWKVKRDNLIRQGINDQKRWAYCGTDIINQINNNDRFGMQSSELKLVCLFEDQATTN